MSSSRRGDVCSASTGVSGLLSSRSSRSLMLWPSKAPGLACICTYWFNSRSTAFCASCSCTASEDSACSLNCCSIVLARSQLKKSNALWPWHSGCRKPQVSLLGVVQFVSLELRRGALFDRFAVVDVYVDFIRLLRVGCLQGQDTPLGRHLDLVVAGPELGRDRVARLLQHHPAVGDGAQIVAVVDGHQGDLRLGHLERISDVQDAAYGWIDVDAVDAQLRFVHVFAGGDLQRAVRRCKVQPRRTDGPGGG